MATKPVRLDPSQNISNVHWVTTKYVILHLSIGTFTGFFPPFSSDVVWGPLGRGDILYHHNDEFFKVWLLTIGEVPKHDPAKDQLFNVTFNGPKIELQPDGYSALNVILDCFSYGAEHEVDLTNYYYPLKRKDGKPLKEKAFLGQKSGRDDILPLTTDAYGTADYFVMPKEIRAEAQPPLVLRG